MDSAVNSHEGIKAKNANHSSTRKSVDREAIPLPYFEKVPGSDVVRLLTYTRSCETLPFSELHK